MKDLIKKHGKKSIGLLSINGLVSVITNLSITLYLAFKAIANKISIGDFTAGITSAQQLASQMLQLFVVIPQLYEHSLYIENFREFMDLSSPISTDRMDILPNATMTIEMKDLCFRYANTENYVLHNINLSINAGEKVAFVGKNGAGKSTIIKLLAGLYEPSAGKIIISGSDMLAYSISSYRNAISVVFQDFQTFSISIAENVLMRPIMNEEDKTSVIEALKLVGLYEKISALPSGINTPLFKEFTNSGVVFSGGELQRLVLARIYVQNNRLIILDEPTSGLDSHAESALIKAIFNSLNDKTVILITHRLNNITTADRIFFLDNGSIIESGSHEELLQANGEYAKMFKDEEDKRTVSTTPYYEKATKNQAQRKPALKSSYVRENSRKQTRVLTFTKAFKTHKEVWCSPNKEVFHTRSKRRYLFSRTAKAMLKSTQFYPQTVPRPYLKYSALLPIPQWGHNVSVPGRASMLTCTPRRSKG